MTRPYQRKTSEQWLALVEAQRQSPLSGVKFCEQHAISYASFCKWKQRFSQSKEPIANDTPDFVDLSSMASATGRWCITLSLGDGVELQLSRD